MSSSTRTLCAACGYPLAGCECVVPIPTEVLVTEHERRAT